MPRLIDANKLKMYIDTCQFCEKCPDIAFMCQRSCELPDCLTSQWERIIDEQPRVDAIPVEWIKKFTEESKRHIQGSVNNYTYMYDYMLSEWKQRKEE